MKKFLLSANKSYFGALDLLFLCGLTSWLQHAAVRDGWRYAGAVAIAVFIVWACCHAIWLVLFEPIEPLAFADRDLRMDFLSCEGLSLIKAGTTWGVMDGNRKMVGGLHDAPHQAVDEAICLSVDRELKEAGLTHG